MPYDSNHDPFKSEARTSASVARLGAAVTPSDTTDLAPYARLYVAASGNLSFIPARNADDAPITIAVVAGQVLPWLVRRVRATGTTATVVTVSN